MIILNASYFFIPDYCMCGDFCGSECADETHTVPRRKKRRGIAPSLKVFKNDIRRYYGSMFLSALNSADTDKLQTYFSTFMVPSCSFTSEKESATAFGLPFLFAVTGPRMMTNYLMCCYIMSPDLVVMLLNNQIVTTNVDTRSRIDLEVEIRYTKIQDVPSELWTPDHDSIQSIYENFCDDAPLAKRKHIKMEKNGGDCVDKDDSEGRKSRAVTVDLSSAPLHSVQRIPDRFIAHVHDAAVKCPAQSVCERAIISLFLDEDNHMQRIHYATAK